MKLIDSATVYGLLAFMFSMTFILSAVLIALGNPRALLAAMAGLFLSFVGSVVMVHNFNSQDRNDAQVRALR